MKMWRSLVHMQVSGKDSQIWIPFLKIVIIFIKNFLSKLSILGFGIHIIRITDLQNDFVKGFFLFGISYLLIIIINPTIRSCLLIEKPPYYNNPSGKIGLLSSMYTLPAYRRSGIATNLLTLVVNEAKEYGCGTVHITASDAGVYLYQDFGFQKSDNFLFYNL